VESKGPQTEPGEGGAPADNVVRLPRDWRGPKDWLDSRDELVPVGPPASAPAAAEPLSPAPSDAEPSPLGADAFWSEGSAAIQDAVRAPSWGVAWGQDEAEDAPASAEAVPRGVPSRRVLLGACATAVLALAGVTGALDSTHSASNGRGLAVAERQAQGKAAPRKANASASAQLLKRRDRGARATTIRRERPSSHVTVAHSRVGRSHPRSAAAVPAQKASVIRSVSQSQAPPAAASTDAATASGHSAPSSSSSGPVGAGAAFGPGHLGS
jgi:hypothetical protein